jgi:hypothetical protein
LQKTGIRTFAGKMKKVESGNARMRNAALFSGGRVILPLRKHKSKLKHFKAVLKHV